MSNKTRRRRRQSEPEKITNFQNFFVNKIHRQVFVFWKTVFLEYLTPKKWWKARGKKGHLVIGTFGENFYKALFRKELGWF